MISPYLCYLLLKYSSSSFIHLLFFCSNAFNLLFLSRGSYKVKSLSILFLFVYFYLWTYTNIYIFDSQIIFILLVRPSKLLRFKPSLSSREWISIDRQSIHLSVHSMLADRMKVLRFANNTLIDPFHNNFSSFEILLGISQSSVSRESESEKRALLSATQKLSLYLTSMSLYWLIMLCQQ